MNINQYLNSDSDNDSVRASDNSIFDTVYDIADSEEDYIDCEKQNGNYYIGSSVYNAQTNTIQLSTAVSINTLLSYDIRAIQLYLEEYSIYSPGIEVPPVHIMQLDIKSDGQYCVVIKTFWLKIIQRAWKTRVANMKKIIRMRGNIQSQYYFAINGRYPPGLINIYGLRGLLA